MKPRWIVSSWSGGTLAAYALYSSERHSRNGSFEASKLFEGGGTHAFLLDNLTEKGVCLLPGAISGEDLQQCREMKSFRDSAAAKTSRKLLLKSHFWESTGGRFHVNQESLVRHFPSDLELLSRLEAAWLPLVSEYLPARDGVRPHRSDLQLLVSLPQSKDQFFHQDNRRQGLTIAVPLVEVTPANGPTQLLPGSHRLTAGRGEEPGPLVDCALLSVLQDGDAAVQAVVPAGAAVIYDSRTLHRGLANNHPTKSRPILVYRYDYPDTPQPGHSISSTLLFRGIGIFICALLELKAYFSENNASAT